MEKRRRKDKTRTKHKQDLIAAGQEKMEQPAAVSKGASQLAEVTFAAGGLQGGACFLSVLAAPVRPVRLWPLTA